MTVFLTGHFEIDHQHSLLAVLADKLHSFCPKGEGPCGEECQHRQSCQPCISALASLAGEMMAFLVGHAIYEESLMALLPSTPVCLRHIELHTQAHSDILRKLSLIASEGEQIDPITTAVKLRRVLSEWLGDHTVEYDRPLTKELLEIEKTEIKFDGELVQILDEFVFHHRPTTLMFSGANNPAAHHDAENVRARLDTLTPRQRDVCELMILGNKNKQIAELLGTTVNTVKTHRTQIFRKMNVSSVLDLVRSLDLIPSQSPSDMHSSDPDRTHGTKTTKGSSCRLIVVEPASLSRQAIVAGLGVLGHRALGLDSLKSLHSLSKDEPMDILIVSIGAFLGSDDLLEQVASLKQRWSCKILLAGNREGGTTPPEAKIVDGSLAWPIDFGELSSTITALVRPAGSTSGAGNGLKLSP